MAINMEKIASEKEYREKKFIDINISGNSIKACEFYDCIFNGLDLLRTTFYHTDLSGADFRESFNYLFDPGSNKCGGARFSSIEVIN